MFGFLAVMTIAAFSCVSWASTFGAFGPRTYTRGEGKPVTVTDQFSVTTPATVYTLRIDNQGVSSAVVTLNGLPVVQESDFNPHVSVITKPVTLSSKNTLSVQLRGKPGESMTLQITGEVPTSTLTVRTFQLDFTAPHNTGPALGGVLVQVNGAEVGATDPTGSLTIQVAPGELHVVGMLPSQAVGSADITVAPQESATVDLLMDFDKEAIDTSAVLTGDEIVDGVLDVTFTSLTLRFQKNGSLVPMATIVSLDLLRPDDRPVAMLEGYFSVDSTGVIRATNVSTLRNLFQAQTGRITLRVLATGANGSTYGKTLQFYLARAPGVELPRGALVPSMSLASFGTIGTYVPPAAAVYLRSHDAPTASTRLNSG